MNEFIKINTLIKLIKIDKKWRTTFIIQENNYNMQK